MVPAPNHSHEQGDANVEELVFAFLESCEDSDVAPSEALDAICAAHPRVATKLRSAVETLMGTGLGLSEGPTGEALQQVGEYRLIDRLGAGGMGIVYRAQHASGGDEVALKLLHPQLQSEPEARQRFAREVSAIERLDHPSIVRVHDHGEIVSDGVSMPFLAMALHRGIALDQAITALAREEVLTTDGAELGGKLAVAIDPGADPLQRSQRLHGPWWKVVARIGADLASALAHAHENGVVHRDVKPSNVFATPEGRPLLLDFGLAVTSDSWRLTRSSAQLGSLPYMPPEQVAGRTTDARVDVYGLGLVLFELLTLRRAFDETTPESLARAIERGKSLRPSRATHWVPGEVASSLDAIIECATDRDPGKRYATARAFADDLAALSAGRPLSVQPISIAGRAARAIRRRPWQTAIAGLVVAFALVGSIVLSHYEGRLEDDERATVATEIESIAARIGRIENDQDELAGSTIVNDPRYAPTALPGLLEDRDVLYGLQERLRVLASEGETVDDLIRRSNGLIADVLKDSARALSALGRYGEAIAGYEAHRAHVELLIEEGYAEDDDELLALRFERSKSFGSLARTIRLSGPAGSSLEAATRAVEIQEEVYAAGYDLEASGFALVSSLMLQCEGHRMAGDRVRAAASLDRAEEISVRTFGPDPTGLNVRAQRGEIELRRAYFEFTETDREGKIALLLRGIEWFDGSARAISSDASVAMLRLSAGRLVADELRLAGRFDEAETWILDAMKRMEGILEERGGAAAPDDPFALELEQMMETAVRIRVDRGDPDGQAQLIALRRATYEKNRVAFGERSADLGARLDYIYSAARYASAAAWEPDGDRAEVENALAAVNAALDASTGLDEGPFPVYGRLRSCRYTRGLALVRVSRLVEAREAAEDLAERANTRDPVDAFALWLTVDLWGELHRANEDQGAAPELRDRTLDALEAAIDAGFDDAETVRGSEVLSPFAADPRFIALLERIEAESND